MNANQFSISPLEKHHDYRIKQRVLLLGWFLAAAIGTIAYFANEQKSS